MATFGSILSDSVRGTIIETPVLALSKQGGPGATDEVLGSADIPAVRMTTATQFLSGRVIGANNWNHSEDVTVLIAVALNGAQSNNDTWDLDFNYIFAEPGVAADADLGKTTTNLVETLTVTTAEGLADETLYVLSFTLDRNDANNPYVSATAGGFAFQMNINSLSSIGSMNIVAIAISYPTM